ncbi:MAG TPA: hypothetical protein VME69_10435 [Methylocella sp.]|nr:hypothetical protein [Methylocella sp.]
MEFAYIANNYHFTADKAAYCVGGASHKWDNTLLSLDCIFGSGRRQGFIPTRAAARRLSSQKL